MKDKPNNCNGCIMLYFDKAKFYSLVDRLDIDESFLSGSGFEDTPHVTLIYGIDMNKFNNKESIDFIKDSLVSSGIISSSFTPKSVSHFSNEDDILKFEFVKDESYYRLKELNSLLTDKFNVISDYPKYIPHSTICHMLTGMANQYGQRLLDYPELKVTKCVLSHKNPDTGVSSSIVLMNNRRYSAIDYIGKELNKGTQTL